MNESTSKPFTFSGSDRLNSPTKTKPREPPAPAPVGEVSPGREEHSSRLADTAEAMQHELLIDVPRIVEHFSDHDPVSQCGEHYRETTVTATKQEDGGQLLETPSEELDERSVAKRLSLSSKSQTPKKRLAKSDYSKSGSGKLAEQEPRLLSRSPILVSPGEESLSPDRLILRPKSDFFLEMDLKFRKYHTQSIPELMDVVKDIERKQKEILLLTKKLETDCYKKLDLIIDGYIKRHCNDRYLSPLNIFQLEVVEQIWSDKKIGDGTLLASHHHILEKLNAKNLRTLAPGTWLNDEVINAYLRLVDNKLAENKSTTRIVNTFFFEQASLAGKNFTKINRMLTKKGIQLDGLKKLIIPLNIKQTHWCFAVIDFSEMTVKGFDSLNSSSILLMDDLVQLANTLLQNKKHATPPKQFERVVVVRDYPRQNNSHDCGVFMLKGIHSLAEHRSLDFSQADAVYSRYHICYELIEGKLIENS